MSSREKLSFERETREIILKHEDGVKIIFVYGEGTIELPSNYEIVKVIFVLQGSKNEFEIIKRTRRFVEKNNKGKIPVYLRISTLGIDGFGCININGIDMARFFKPTEPSYEAMRETVSV